MTDAKREEREAKAIIDKLIAAHDNLPTLLAENEGLRKAHQDAVATVMLVEQRAEKAESSLAEARKRLLEMSVEAGTQQGHRERAEAECERLKQQEGFAHNYLDSIGAPREKPIDEVESRIYNVRGRTEVAYDRLRADLAAAVEVMRKLEWSHRRPGGTPCCPWCSCIGKHSDDCQLAAVLSRQGGKKE